MYFVFAVLAVKVCELIGRRFLFLSTGSKHRLSRSFVCFAQLFGNVTTGQCIDDHANFTTFPWAMLTLVRMSTVCVRALGCDISRIL
jgi:hypothetical protein